MDFTPIKFTRTDERGERTLTARTPAQAVKLRFDGWAEEKDPNATPPQPAADGTVITPADEPAGEADGADGGKTRRAGKAPAAK